MEAIGVILLALAIFFGGGLIGHFGASASADQRCEKGEPVVVNTKVYRCVEQK